MGLNLAVCVPSHDNCTALFAYDLANMMGVLGVAVGQEKIENVSIFTSVGTYIHSARQQLIEMAINAGADYILWLDSDMRFPSNAVFRLLSHNVDLVGINYSTRGVPPVYTAIKTTGIDNGTGIAEKVETTADKTGLEEASAIGFGCCLMRTEWLHRLHDPYGEKGPWFFFEWNPEHKGMVGEDVYFCRLAREVGATVYVDHDLSKECAHIGQLEYKLDHVWATQGLSVETPDVDN